VPELPPEDQADTIDIGPVKGIPTIEDDDPRFTEERAAWSRATAKAQAMHSADELVGGMDDLDWRVRQEVVDRLIARAWSDERTLPALIRHLRRDDAWQVRSQIAMALSFDELPEVVEALVAAENDPHPDVRWSVQWRLAQAGLRPYPEDLE